jgi:hypothetical protein
MTIDRRLSPTALLLPALLLFSAPALAQSVQSWNGVWAGVQGAQAAPILVSIADGKVVSYTLKGSPFEIQYSSVTPATVSFGDHDHYFVKLRRTGDTTASGKIHGRLGVGALSLTKQ